MHKGQPTFLFTDIAGSTRLWERESTTMAEALQRHDVLLRAAMTEHDGIVFKTVGDAFCVVFDDPVAAVGAAIAAQHAVNNEPWATSTPLRVRMALHTGVAHERDGDYFGPALNRVARLLAAGHGGQILASQAVTDQVSDQHMLRNLGLHRLKDLSQPEHIWQVVAANLPDDFPPLRSLEAFSHNLPIQRTSFVGREQELDDLRQRLPKTRLLTLTGPGGTGKTRLSLQIAAELVEHYADGVWLVELAPLRDPTLVPSVLAKVLGLKDDGQISLLEHLCAAIGSRHMAIILDNCEHVIAAAAQLADVLLQRCPHVTCLATSREPLQIAGEAIVRVPTLQLPKPKIALDTALESEAVRLFVQRTEHYVPGFTVTPQNLEAVVQICQQLDGIPLALELAAARVPMLHLEQLAARLDDRFRVLSSGQRSALPHQQTLRALVDWSYDLLSRDEQILMARLGIFAGGWDLAAVEAVCSAAPLDQGQSVELLLALVNKSLVFVEEDEHHEPRYGMLETLRLYAQEKLNASGEAETLARRHFEWCLNQSLADSVAFGLREMDNIRVALKWCQRRSDGASDGLRLSRALDVFWHTFSYLTEGRAWVEGWIHAPDVPPEVLAPALAMAGYLAFRQDDYERAEEHYEWCLKIQQQRNNPRGIARVSAGMADVARGRTQHEKAITLYKRGLDLMKHHKMFDSMPRSMVGLAIIYYFQGDYEIALKILHEALDVTTTHNVNRIDAWIQRNIAMVLQGQERWDAAREIIDACIALACQIAHSSLHGYATLNKLLDLWQQQQFNEAVALGIQIEPMIRLLNDRWMLLILLQYRGLILHSIGEFSGALEAYRESLDLQSATQNVSATTEVFIGIAALLKSLQMPAESQWFCQAAVLIGKLLSVRPIPVYRRMLESMLADAPPADPLKPHELPQEPLELLEEGRQLLQSVGRGMTTLMA